MNDKRITTGRVGCSLSGASKSKAVPHGKMNWELRVTMQQAGTVASPTRLQSHRTDDSIGDIITLSIHSQICTVR